MNTGFNYLHEHVTKPQARPRPCRLSFKAQRAYTKTHLAPRTKGHSRTCSFLGQVESRIRAHQVFPSCFQTRTHRCWRKASKEARVIMIRRAEKWQKSKTETLNSTPVSATKLHHNDK